MNRKTLSALAIARLPAVAWLVGIVISASGALASPAPGAAPDHERGDFAPCVGYHRVTCIVDGDTLWYRGEKIRIADINAPELSHPQCDAEYRLAAAATARLTQLMNAGAFTLAPWPGRRYDKYGRSLYVIDRGGESVGMALTREGLAERWKGYRGTWCGALG